MIELPPKEAQTQFNLSRWEQVMADSEFTKFTGRIETDRFGRIIMSPPPGFDHGSYQAEIVTLIRKLLPTGRVVTECPVSTRDGVRGVDVAWLSSESLAAIPKDTKCLANAPQICIEVVSPSNSETELVEKKMLYFDAGAKEVWSCREGKLSFYTKYSDSRAEQSVLCSQFPTRIHI